MNANGNVTVGKVPEVSEIVDITGALNGPCGSDSSCEGDGCSGDCDCDGDTGHPN